MADEWDAGADYETDAVVAHDGVTYRASTRNSGNVPPAFPWIAEGEAPAAEAPAAEPEVQPEVEPVTDEGAPQ